MSTPEEAVVEPFQSRRVGTVPFSVTTLEGAVRWVVGTAAATHLPVNVRLANAWNVALARKDGTYGELMATRGVNFPDGTPVVWAMNARRTGGGRAGRVRGPSLFAEVLREGVPHGVRHYLLGGSPETLAALVAALPSRYPGIEMAGSYSPPFAPVTDEYVEDCAERIGSSNADLVWVGLGTPKQDVVGTALAQRLGVTVLNVGAAFDFAAGNVREAPVWIQRSGFEWLFRLASEPRRLWRRYLIGNFQFVAAVIAGWRRPGDGA